MTRIEHSPTDRFNLIPRVRAQPLMSAQEQQLAVWKCWKLHVLYVNIITQTTIAVPDLKVVDKLIVVQQKLFEQVPGRSPSHYPHAARVTLRLRLSTARSCTAQRGCGPSITLPRTSFWIFR